MYIRMYILFRKLDHDHEDNIRNGLTETASQGQAIPDKVIMVTIWNKSKFYYCFIKLSGILHR